MRLTDVVIQNTKTGKESEAPPGRQGAISGGAAVWSLPLALPVPDRREGEPLRARRVFPRQATGPRLARRGAPVTRGSAGAGEAGAASSGRPQGCQGRADRGRREHIRGDCPDVARRQGAGMDAAADQAGHALAGARRIPGDRIDANPGREA